MRRLCFALLFCLAPLVGSCGEDPEDHDRCTSTDDCAGGDVCVDTYCKGRVGEKCIRDWECASGDCLQGVCQKGIEGEIVY